MNFQASNSDENDENDRQSATRNERSAVEREAVEQLPTGAVSSNNENSAAVMSCSELPLSSEAPKVMKNDIRRYFGKMMLNTINSGDSLQIQSFFQTFMIQSGKLVMKHTVPPELNIPPKVIVDGPRMVPYVLLGAFVLVPDISLKAKNTTIITSNSWSGTKIVIDLEMHGTKIFEMGPRKWLPYRPLSAAAAAEEGGGGGGGAEGGGGAGVGGVGDGGTRGGGGGGGGQSSHPRPNRSGSFASTGVSGGGSGSGSGSGSVAAPTPGFAATFRKERKKRARPGSNGSVVGSGSNSSSCSSSGGVVAGGAVSGTRIPDLSQYAYRSSGGSVAGSSMGSSSSVTGRSFAFVDASAGAGRGGCGGLAGGGMASSMAKALDSAQQSLLLSSFGPSRNAHTTAVVTTGTGTSEGAGAGGSVCSVNSSVNHSITAATSDVSGTGEEIVGRSGVQEAEFTFSGQSSAIQGRYMSYDPPAEEFQGRGSRDRSASVDIIDSFITDDCARVGKIYGSCDGSALPVGIVGEHVSVDGGSCAAGMSVSTGGASGAVNEDKDASAAMNAFFDAGYSTSSSTSSKGAFVASELDSTTVSAGTCKGTGSTGTGSTGTGTDSGTGDTERPAVAIPAYPNEYMSRLVQKATVIPQASRLHWTGALVIFLDPQHHIQHLYYEMAAAGQSEGQSEAGSPVPSV
jgi:hypothetical protein